MISRDIESREDVKALVDKFYEQVIADPIIGHFFTEVIVLDWEKHMPIMYDFWETILLGNISYKGNPMLKHIALNQQSPISDQHFDRWLELWDATLKQLYRGPNADEALNRAKQIAELMKFKVKQHS